MNTKAYSVSGIVHENIRSSRVKSHISLLDPFRTVRSQRHLSEHFGERHILHGEMTGRLL